MATSKIPVFSPKLMVKSKSITMTYSSGYSNTSADIAESGYTPIGVVGFMLGTSFFSPASIYVSAVTNRVYIDARYHSNPQYSGTVTATAYILYTQN